MRPPLLNLLLASAGAFLIFVGMAVHPSLVVLGLGAAVALVGILFRFEPRTRRRKG